MMIFEGSAVALVTPFNEDLSVDYDTYRNLVRFHLENKTDALVVCGTTSEASTLSEEEKLKLIDITIKESMGEIPVIVGTGSNNSKKSAEFSRKVSAIDGVDALLVVTPYYNKASQEGLYEHFKLIASYSTKPIILYNVPSRTNVNIEIDTLKRLAQIENIVAIKDASGDLNYTSQIKNSLSDDFYIYSGNDNLILPMLSVGAKGVISVFANICPDISHDICSQYLEGNVERSRDLQLQYLDLINDLFKEVNPIPVKSAMSLMNLCDDTVRLPLTKAEDRTREKLKNDLLDLELLKALNSLGA